MAIVNVGISGKWNTYRPSNLVRGLRSKSYEAHIDGLRALAVLSVVAFHIWPDVFPLGWIGVDVFFVVSGYLITQVLIRDITSNNFNIFDFMGRRLRRLYPQLLAMLLASSALALIVFNSQELREFAVRQLSAMGYLSNVIFSLEGSYFAETKYLNPLLHTWSLGVEEQFYIAAPLLLILLWRAKAWKILPGFLVVGATLSIVVWAVLQTGSVFPTFGANIAFYWLPARAWELIIGGLLAWSIHIGTTKVQKYLAIQLVSVLFTISLLSSVYSSSLWPSVTNISAVFATALLIQFGGNRKLRFLEVGWLREIGLLSYAIYIWHWPIICFVTILLGPIDDNLGLAAVAILCTAMASLLSFKFVEIKFRYAKRPGSRVKQKRLGSLTTLVLFSLLFLSAPTLQSAESQAARVLSEVETIYFSGLNERVFVKHRLDGVRSYDEWEALAIGSSRMMQVDSSLTGRRTLNISVYGANVEDLVYLALRGQSATGVNEIYLSLDPWMLNENYRDKRWNIFFELGSQQIEAVLASDGSAQALRSIDKESETNLPALVFDAINQSERFLVASNKQPDFRDKLTRDGRLILNTSTQRISLATDQLAKGWTHGSLDDFELSETKIGYLNRLLAELDKRQVSVYLVLLPYHPAVLNGVSQMEARAAISKIEEIVTQLATSNNVRLLGSFDPELVGCSNEEFLDSIHPLQGCSARVLQTRRHLD